jgi:hypothetical protein
MLPLVYRGEAIGLLEASDARRARSYSRQELRLCQAVAGQAAVALHNTSLRAASRSGRDDLAGLREALRDIAGPLAAALTRDDEGALLERLARAVCDVLGAVSCVVATPRRSAGAARPVGSGPESREAGPAGPDSGWQASATVESDGQASLEERPARDGCVLVGREASGSVSITVTLPRAPSDGVAELLDLITAIAAVAAARVSAPPTPRD